MYVQVSSISENYLTCVAFMATSIFGTAFPSKVIYVHFSRHNSCWTDPLWWYRKSSKPSWPKWTIPSLPPQVPHLAATRWLAGRLLTDLAPKKALFLKDLTPLVSEEVKQFCALLKTAQQNFFPKITEGHFPFFSAHKHGLRRRCLFTPSQLIYATMPETRLLTKKIVKNFWCQLCICDDM